MPKAERPRRNANDDSAVPQYDRTDTGADQTVVPSLLALQQHAGNAAVSRLIAGARVVQRQPDKGAPADGGSPPPAPTPAPAPAAPAGAGSSDGMLAMARIAWQTGVIQRERDAAAKLAQPHARKPEMQDAAQQLSEARDAVHAIGDQVATIDPNRRTRATVHANAILIPKEGISVLVNHETPRDIADTVTAGVVPAAAGAIADLAAPAPPGGPSGAPAPGGATAPAPAPSGSPSP
jgi:hypothetical protein